ncbi:MAG: SBBP repeat-containing protein, partial [Myxococcaceae bacterium]
MARSNRRFAGGRAGPLCWVLGILWMGCAGSSSTPAPSAVGGRAQTSTVTVNGPSGASVTVPPGASAVPLAIAITQAPATAPALDPALPRLSSVFAVTPHGASFDVPVTVQIPFDSSGVSEDTDLVVLQAEEGGQWKALPAVLVDLDAHTAQVEVTSFSYFIVTMRPLTTSGAAPTLTIAPVDPSFQLGSGGWQDPGNPAATPTLIPVRVAVSGAVHCPAGTSPGIAARLVDTGGLHHGYYGRNTPLDVPWPPDASQIELPLLLDPTRTRSLENEGLTSSDLTFRAILFCTDGVDANVNSEQAIPLLARSQPLRRSLAVSSPMKLGIGREPADITVAPGTRPVFITTIVGGPPKPTEGDQYTVTWQRSDDGGLTWRQANDVTAYQLQMQPHPHLWSSASGTGFSVRQSTFAAPLAEVGDDGALFQAKACYAIPPSDQQYSTATTDCVFSRPAKLTVGGGTVSPGPPSITRQPQGVTVTAPGPATFSVTATGDAPLAYQWLRNGVAIAGATGASFTTPATAVSDSGATFSVVVWNHGGAVVSEGAQLTVTAAAAGFQVVHVDPADGSEGNLAATFSTSTATFSANLDCDHLPASSFQVLEGASTIPGTVGCSGKTLSFTPAADAFPTNTTLHVLLDAGIGDGAGHTLGGAYTWSFGVAPWTRQIGSPSYDEARAVRVDAQGNVFAVGYTKGGLDGNTLTGITDLFAVKYAPSGARLWTRQLGLAGTFTSGLAAAVDGAGNLYVAGECGGALDGNTSNGSSDIVLVKYDPAGTKLWTHQYGTAADDHVGGVAIDATGNVYLSAWTQGSFGGMPTAGAEDIVVLKLDSTGNVQWIRDTGSPGTDEPTSVAVDGNGNVLVAGYTTGVLAGPGNAGMFDLFVAKFDPAGTYLWARQLGTPGIDVATAVAADASGNVYVTGYTYGSLDGHPNQGSIDGFVLKYDPSGVKQWSVLLGTPGDDFGLGITVDASGSPYVVGRTSGALDGGGNNSAAQLYVAALDPTTG